jgi:putative ABC transport system permease protein
MVWENNPRFPRVWVSYPNFRDWQRSARSFQEMAAFLEQGVDLTSPGIPEHLNGKKVSSGFFRTLGAELDLGREFSPEEDRHGGNPVIIISNRLWRNRFDGSPEALGKPITLNGVDYTIVGVTPRGFRLAPSRSSRDRTGPSIERLDTELPSCPYHLDLRSLHG